jgi:hypothetical protein
MALSVLLVRFLCGGHNGTSTPVIRTDGHHDAVGYCCGDDRWSR